MALAPPGYEALYKPGQNTAAAADTRLSTFTGLPIED